MITKQCFECKGELPFAVSSDLIKSPSCGAVNESESNGEPHLKSIMDKKRFRNSEASGYIGSISGGCSGDTSGDGGC